MIITKLQKTMSVNKTEKSLLVESFSHSSFVETNFVPFNGNT